MTRIKKSPDEWTDEDYEHERHHDWLDAHGKTERTYKKRKI